MTPYSPNLNKQQSLPSVEDALPAINGLCCAPLHENNAKCQPHSSTLAHIQLHYPPWLRNIELGRLPGNARGPTIRTDIIAGLATCTREKRQLYDSCTTATPCRPPAMLDYLPHRSCTLTFLTLQQCVSRTIAVFCKSYFYLFVI